MATAFLTAAQAVVDALQADPALADGRVYLGRDAPMPEHHASEVRVGIESTSGRMLTLGATDVLWETTIGVEVRQRAAGGGTALPDLDALVEAVFTRLAQATAAPGSSAWQMEPTIRWQLADADTPIATAGLALRVEQITGGGTLQPAA